MTPGEVVLHAALWLEEHHPMQFQKWVDVGDAGIVWTMEIHYPTGLAGFVEDMTQSSAVS